MRRVELKEKAWNGMRYVEYEFLMRRVELKVVFKASGSLKEAVRS